MTINLNKISSFPGAILEQNKQENEISLQKWVKGKIDDEIKSINPNNTIISNTSLNQDWSTVDVYTYLLYDYINHVYTNSYYIYKSFRVEFGELNIKYLDYFKFELITRNGEAGDGDSTGFAPVWTGYDDIQFQKFWAWDIKDLTLEPTSNVKKIALVISFAHNRWLYDFRTFQTKLLIQYCNNSILI